jgi:NADPH-dependent ferric siderophore reductase
MTKMFYDATVLSSRYLTSGMVRVTLGGEGLAGYPGTGVADEYMRFFFPNEETGRLHLPHIDEQGRWTYPDGGQEAIRCSTYTVRALRPEVNELDIDFVVHKGGLASEWAQKARPGDRITVNRPRGIATPPADAVWQLLVCDATGIPALSRMLEQSPDNIQTRVFVEVAEAAHEQQLPHNDFVTVTWLHRSGNGVAPSRLADVIKAMPMAATPGYIWVAGEQKVVRTIRKYVRQDLKLPTDRYELVSYWTNDSEAWEAGWKALPQDVKDAIDASWSSGRDIEDLRDEYYATLEKYGL